MEDSREKGKKKVARVEPVMEWVERLVIEQKQTGNSEEEQWKKEGSSYGGLSAEDEGWRQDCRRRGK